MTGILALDVFVALAIVGGGLAVARKALAVLKRVSIWLDDWNGEPARPGVEERPGVMARLGSIEERQGAIEAELHPNHGSSLRDVVNRTEAGVRRVEHQLAAHLADHAKEDR